MNEVEVKLLEIDSVKVIKTLKQLGAKKTFEGPVAACYYEMPNRGLKRQKKVLRLRQRGDNWELTFKQGIKSKTTKRMNELEVRVDSGKRMAEILANLGFIVYAKFAKKRISYSLGNIHFEIDQYPGIPVFLEIEAGSVREIEFWVKRLGYSMSQAKPWSTYDLFKHYKKNYLKGA